MTLFSQAACDFNLRGTKLKFTITKSEFSKLLYRILQFQGHASHSLFFQVTCSIIQVSLKVKILHLFQLCYSVHSHQLTSLITHYKRIPLTYMVYYLILVCKTLFMFLRENPKSFDTILSTICYLQKKTKNNDYFAIIPDIDHWSSRVLPLLWKRPRPQCNYEPEQDTSISKLRFTNTK